jgi:hypothetical protein
MALDINKVRNAVAQAVEKGPDMTQASTGGGDYVPPAAGPCVATFVGYVETGIHTTETTVKGKKVPKTKPRAELTFELAGGKNPPKEIVKENGEKVYIPHRIVVRVTTAEKLNAKAAMFKLFSAMNHEGTARHISELLGKHFLVEVLHDVDKQDPNKVYASLGNGESGYTIKAPFIMTGDLLAGNQELKAIPAPAILSPLKLFLWDFPDMDQWESIFIDGEYEARPAEGGKPAQEAKSKNVIQNKIRSAENWKGSAMQLLLEGDLDVSVLEAGPAAATATVGAGADPLAGLL